MRISLNLAAHDSHRQGPGNGLDACQEFGNPETTMSLRPKRLSNTHSMFLTTKSTVELVK